MATTNLLMRSYFNGVDVFETPVAVYVNALEADEADATLAFITSGFSEISTAHSDYTNLRQYALSEIQKFDPSLDGQCDLSNVTYFIQHIEQR